MANDDTRTGNRRRNGGENGGENGREDGRRSRGGMDSRAWLLDLLLEKIAEDPYPSGTMMDLAEELLLPGDVPAYAAVLMEKIRGDAFPSVPMMRRLVELVEPA